MKYFIPFTDFTKAFRERAFSAKATLNYSRGEKRVEVDIFSLLDDPGHYHCNIIDLGYADRDKGPALRESLSVLAGASTPKDAMRYAYNFLKDNNYLNDYLREE